MRHLLLRLTICAFICMAFACVQVQAEALTDGVDEIQLSTDVIKFDKDLEKDVKILKGKNFMVYSGSDWVKYNITKDGLLKVSVKPYSKFYSRKSSIILTSKKTNYSKVLTIVQTAGNNRPEVISKATGAGLCFLSEMDLTNATFYYIKQIHKNKSVDGRAITMKSSRYEEGIATHAPSTMLFRVNGAKRFIADLAIDDEVIEHQDESWGVVGYKVELDGKVVKEGKLKLFDNEIVPLNIDLKGAKEMKLLFTEDGSTYGDHVDLGNARFEYVGEKPVTLKVKEKK